MDVHPAVHFSTLFMAFFAIMNPIANAPISLSLTEGLPAAVRRRIALRAVLLALAIVAAFALGGRTLFSIFGITLPAFRIAGGALVGLVGYQMLQGTPSSVQSPAADDSPNEENAALDIAISPLALPILAGPGAIATAISFAAESSLAEVTRVLAAFGLMCGVTWITFIMGDSLTRFLGRSAIMVVTRLMGLILAVIGVDMLIAGIRGAVDAS
jgi:multiple antibiotic resistance protein